MVRLRAREPEDIDLLYQLENDQTLWEVSETQAPFSRQLLLSYIENAHQDIYQAKQQRFVITYQEKAVGCADLYDYQPKNKRASVAMAVVAAFRQKGIATKALELLCHYAFTFLDLHQLTAYIHQENLYSQKLFLRQGFLCTATLKDWCFFDGNFQNVYLYQYFKP